MKMSLRAGPEAVLGCLSGDGVGLDLDASEAALGDVVGAPVVAFALGEGDFEEIGD
jgi:hypothetical protein